jgi:nucleotide-binding universal stress UspA family protein
MISRITPIVAGVASCRVDDPALSAGLHLASRLGAALHLLHVEPGYARGGTAGPDRPSFPLRAALKAAAPGAAGMPRVRTRVVTGSPDRWLLDSAREADAGLLVLGATRRGPAAGALLGTTAGHVLRGADAPVLVVRGPLPDRPLRVLLTTDLSHHGAHAHARGASLARMLGAPFGSETRTLFVDPVHLPVEPWASPQQEADALRELRDFLQGEAPTVASTACVRRGDPATEIVREAHEWGADLLVLGTHGRRGPLRLFLGSVAETVVRRLPCAVLVVPSVGAPLSNGGARAGTSARGHSAAIPIHG